MAAAGRRPTSNGKHRRPRPSRNIRGREADFDLDSRGLKFVSHSTAFAQWYDRHAVALLKDHVEGAHEVQILDWRVTLSNYLELPTYPEIPTYEVLALGADG